jgi:exonuclease III
MDSDNILIWNVCGLNSCVHRIVVADMVAQEHISLVCIQESKLSVLNDSLVMSICGGDFEYCYVLADGTRGGTMVAW